MLQPTETVVLFETQQCALPSGRSGALRAGRPEQVVEMGVPEDRNEGTIGFMSFDPAGAAREPARREMGRTGNWRN